MKNCTVCNKQYSPDCDYNQGRCPHHPPMIEQIIGDPYKARYYNLVQSLKNLFRKTK